MERKETRLVMGTYRRILASLVAQKVKNLPANAGEPGSIPGSGGVPWRRKWQPTPVFLSGEFHGQMSLVGYSFWCHKQSDVIERLTLKKTL